MYTGVCDRSHKGLQLESRKLSGIKGLILLVTLRGHVVSHLSLSLCCLAEDGLFLCQLKKMHNLKFENLKKNYLFIFGRAWVFGAACVLSLVAVTSGCCLGVVSRLLIAVVSLLAEHRL